MSHQHQRAETHIEKTLVLLKQHCEKVVNRDYQVILALIASIGTLDKISSEPGWGLVTCGGHEIKVSFRTFGHGGRMME